MTRRRLLASVAAMASVAANTPLDLLAGPAAPPGLSFHLVDGWILTSRDLEALGLHAV